MVEELYKPTLQSAKTDAPDAKSSAESGSRFLHSPDAKSIAAAACGVLRSPNAGASAAVSSWASLDSKRSAVAVSRVSSRAKSSENAHRTSLSDWLMQVSKDDTRTVYPEPRRASLTPRLETAEKGSMQKPRRASTTPRLKNTDSGVWDDREAEKENHELGNAAEESLGSTEAAFKTFCSVGRSTMDGRCFLKLCSACCLIDGMLSAADVELIFKKVASKSQYRSIDLTQFELALILIAEKKGVNAKDVFLEVEQSRRPKQQRQHVKESGASSCISVDPRASIIDMTFPDSRDPRSDRRSSIFLSPDGKAQRELAYLDRLLAVNRLSNAGTFLVQHNA
eukprot:gnl/TRDRNA2_/TRDRNA2_44568_c0_seq1.p1 gnl/TRDRNA2_/TRDRNA2_44568_c0~~gnl/TRDRNA2_/TRDRNA2_44568_c0_seq1.p1  ORF type:complete len:338 (-),score=60.70 gnl/TRDRNA2_/TRDRNA2_44568_c0_seq1:69-1082(-)